MGSRPPSHDRPRDRSCRKWPRLPAPRRSPRRAASTGPRVQLQSSVSAANTFQYYSLMSQSLRHFCIFSVRERIVNLGELSLAEPCTAICACLFSGRDRSFNAIRATDPKLWLKPMEKQARSFESSQVPGWAGRITPLSFQFIPWIKCLTISAGAVDLALEIRSVVFNWSISPMAN